MDDLKYVIVSRGDGLEVPILLSCVLSHAGVIGYRMVPVAAGFVRLRATKDGGAIAVECYGRSESLGRCTRGEADERIIRRELERTLVR